MDNLLKIRLRAVNPTLHYDREYKLRLGTDLFERWFVVITFGRYHSWGTSRTSYFETREEAYIFVNSKLKRRLSSPKRIGCPYQMVALDGRDDILETISKKVIERFSWFGSSHKSQNKSSRVAT
jgi:hypothetical protein